MTSRSSRRANCPTAGTRCGGPPGAATPPCCARATGPEKKFATRSQAIDAEIGVYYIDHNTQSTFLDPPWDDYVKLQAAQMMEFIRDQEMRLRDMEAKMAVAADRRQKEAEQRLHELEKQRQELEAMLANGKGGTVTEEELLARLEDNLERQRLEALIAAADPEETAKQIAMLKRRLAELLAVNEKLRADQNRDDLGDSRRARDEILKLRQQLDREAAERARMEEEIMRFKRELEGLGTPTLAVPAVLPPPPEPPLPVMDPIAAFNRRKTRYDMEIEILMLKKRIEAERAEKERLKYLKDGMDGIAGGGPGSMPEWLKKLQAVASNSKTLRIQIARKQEKNPDQLSFRERMLYFTSGAVETNIQGGAPPKPTFKLGTPSPKSPAVPTAPDGKKYYRK
eukprot:Unigene1209_Nuclearia_a/m.3856 Unigene1209_Nuclearia_a/g.3856  ORF Unigene1209_Nuclearia_a/g.3856 Unigene1209_Nuclearia_a/m.3856 type:complete len:397 (+) Unigene1209_Nuclearia_a:366-1556(+)